MTLDDPDAAGSTPPPPPPVATPADAPEPVVAAPVAPVEPARPVEPAMAPAPAPAALVAPPVQQKAPKLLRVLAVLVMISGLIILAAGVVTWFVVRDQLSQEHITVSEDAEHFAGDPVDGPWTAYAQADAINKHALEAGGGKTYAELPRDDPARDTVMTASFLRASLFTSVVSFGVAAFAAGMGLLMLIVGYVLLRLAKLIGTTVQAAPAVT
jgi:hypothetical protein